MNGIIIIDKPQGWTSMDVCARLRGVFHEKRIGHGGTLDPMATGVLPVFVGRATRGVEFATESDKEYRAELKLGLVTTTQDTQGEVLEQREASVTREELEAVLERFRGPQSQVPPMYSAIKVQGKKLYELARKGKEVERAPRRIVIRELELEEAVAPDTFRLRVRCTKGTYIRTLCHDIGQALGCGGCMSALRRTMAAGYRVEQAIPRVLESEDPGALLLPVESLFADRSPLTLGSAAAEKKVRNGGVANLPGQADGEYRVFGTDGTFLALGRVEREKLKTIRSFFEV